MMGFFATREWRTHHASSGTGRISLAVRARGDAASTADSKETEDTDTAHGCLGHRGCTSGSVTFCEDSHHDEG